MIDITSHKTNPFSFRNISKDQSKDTGMVCTLICLLLALYFKDFTLQFMAAAMSILVINIVVPILFKPLAWIWFGIALVLGSVMSKVILSLLYIIMIIPVGFIRMILGKDSLYLKKWKKGGAYVFHIRDHTFTAKDIEHPY